MGCFNGFYLDHHHQSHLMTLVLHCWIALAVPFPFITTFLPFSLCGQQVLCLLVERTGRLQGGLWWWIRQLLLSAVGTHVPLGSFIFPLSIFLCNWEISFLMAATSLSFALPS